MRQTNNIRQYEQLIGTQKFRALWLEFCEDANKKLCDAPNASSEQQRLIFHSLRASSLIFDMTEFALFCQKLEEQILQNIPLSQKDFEESKKILKENSENVVRYFQGLCEI